MENIENLKSFWCKKTGKHYFIEMFLVLLLLLASCMVSAASFVEVAKLTAPDAAAGDHFGGSVSFDGNTIVVGAPGDDDGTFSGSAYVFTRNGTTWTKQQKLTASDAAASDRFGYSVLVDGNMIVIGAYGDDDDGNSSGSAYVFTRSGTTWTEETKLTASDATAGDLFGFSVSFDGDTIVVGAPADDRRGIESGSAYVFTHSGTTWTEQQKFTASETTSFDRFGYSVSIYRNTIVIGAYGVDRDGSSYSGAAYVFNRSGTTWTEQQNLKGHASDRLGQSVLVDEDTIVVGASGVHDSTFSGSAYVFPLSDMTWTEKQVLMPSDRAKWDNFGFSFSIDRDMIVVGAPADDYGGNLSGSAFMFTRSDTTWTEQQKLTGSDSVPDDIFGCSVSFDGDTIVVGAPGDDDCTFSGSAYVFTNLVMLASCDDSGAEQYSFNLSEDVYCLGENLAADTSVDIYVVNNKDVWKYGDALTDVSGKYETETTGDDGSISTTLIWDSPLTLGSYDIVVDINQNGKWNKGEPIDDIVSVGFEAIPEFPSIAIPVTAILGLMFLFSNRRRKE